MLSGVGVSPGAEGGAVGASAAGGWVSSGRAGGGAAVGASGAQAVSARATHSITSSSRFTSHLLEPVITAWLHHTRRRAGWQPCRAARQSLYKPGERLEYRINMTIIVLVMDFTK
jgi:hypothetical protein